MTAYKINKYNTVYDIMSQIKEIFPARSPGNYETLCYNDMQEKLYKVAKKRGCIKILKKFGVLD